MKRFIHIILILLIGLVSCQKAPFLTFNGQRNLSFKDNGGTETITFSCNNAWTVSSSANWLKVSPSQGSANEGGVKVTITCEANTTYDPRTGTVTIMSEGITETISVSQDTNYGLMSEPTTFNLTNAAQNIEVEVKANVEYTITIDDAGKDWISQVGTKALSSTKLTFSIAANEGYDDREGKITISQKGNTSVQPQVITVKQSQANGLFITTPEYELSNEAHDLTVEVKANIEYEVTSEVDWVKYEPSATKALTTSSFTLKVEKNESYDPRVGTVKVKGGGLEGVITITQAEILGLFVSPTEKSISEEAQEVEVEVNANVEYDIIVPDEAKGMITTVKKQGGGDTKALSATKYLFGVSENTQNVGREASITFKQKDGALCGTVKISQEKADVIDFEDAKFKAYCVRNFDTNGDGEISYAEAKKVKSINCAFMEISSLEGIQYFTSITELNCADINLTSLDVSKCTKLTSLECYYNSLTSLDVSKCTKLTYLNCSNNNLTSLDVSKNTALIYLFCENNQLTSLDASKCTELTKLWCEHNNLTSLDVSGCTKLTTLSCFNNNLTSLDVSECTELSSLNCSNTPLTSLDVSGCTKLTTLHCDNNSLTSLDVSKCAELTNLTCTNTQLTSLDVSGCTKLTTLSCFNNNLTSLDVSGCTKLATLECLDNNLTSLDVSKCTELTKLWCELNNLTSLDVSGCTKLTSLTCNDNSLTSLDVSECTELSLLNCSDNPLTSLDVSGCTKLTYFFCTSNQLTSLDISNNTALTRLWCFWNQISTIYVWEGFDPSKLDIKKDPSASFVVKTGE